jgi:glycosyltransferase involved in cell wall biosynthesis
MISLILPYWNRQKAADNALALLIKHYAQLDLEVVVVDDGNRVPYVAPAHAPFPIKVVRMPLKDIPMDACSAVNRGVAESSGDVIALSGVEMLHHKPVLGAMLEELQRGDEMTYVIAAVWNPDSSRWHVHSSISGIPVCGVPMPKGSHYHFMTMLRRSLWDKAGGLDEEYRQGTGYDDPDFLKRLERVGTKFVIRDDLVVEHPKKDARSNWGPGMFERNKRLFISKWGRK